jgi:hypothetical protein
MDFTSTPFLLLLFHLWIGRSLSIRQQAPRKALSPHQFEPLPHIALIKQEILRNLGKSDDPKTRTPIHKSMPSKDTDDEVTEYRVTDITSFHSEPPGTLIQ